MKDFTTLLNVIDETTKTSEKVAALKDYFDVASGGDKLWAIAILLHRPPKRTVTTTQLREWAVETSNIPQWLFEETYRIVGDLAETIAKVVQDDYSNIQQDTSTSLNAPHREGAERSRSTYHITSHKNLTLSDIIQELTQLKGKAEGDQKHTITSRWKGLSAEERFVYNKLLTGGFRMRLSQKLVQRALAQHSGLDEAIIALRLMGNWQPGKTTFQELVLEGDPEEENNRPYPFHLAYSKEFASNELGPVSDWQFEYKWNGIRGQLVKRASQMHVWSRGEELVTNKFPEYAELARELPNGTVLDGEILPMVDNRPLSFHLLQERVGRKTLSKKHLREIPVYFMAYDLLEFQNQDFRNKPLVDRRAVLEQLAKSVNSPFLLLSTVHEPQTWTEAGLLREEARKSGAEGLMIKKLGSSYKSGRVKGDWWKWKVDPFTIDAVMIYATRGHGRSTNQYADFTFAVWKAEELVPFAKAYSGLSDAEIHKIDAFVKENTQERFGPVRSVKPELVFELAFEGINKSTRHKSGLAVRFPRIKRWRKDKKATEANKLSDLFGLINY